MYSLAQGCSTNLVEGLLGPAVISFCFIAFVLVRLSSLCMGKQFNGSVWPRSLQHTHHKTNQGGWIRWGFCSSDCCWYFSQFGLDSFTFRKVMHVICI